MDNGSWWDDAKGVNCRVCNNETLRVVDGLCPTCVNAKRKEDNEKEDVRRMRRYYMRELRRGFISLKQMAENELVDS